MAIKKSWKKTIAGFSGELTLIDAYCKVEQINGDKNHIDYTMSIAANQDATPVETLFFSFVPELQGVNFIAQAYADAKKKPEFAGSQDC